jgi:predicted Zn-dependent protease
MTGSLGLKVAIIIAGLSIIVLLMMADRKALVNADGKPENNRSEVNSNQFFPSSFNLSDNNLQDAVMQLEVADSPQRRAEIWQQVADQSTNPQIQMWAHAQAAITLSNAENIKKALQAFEAFEYPQDSTLASDFKNAELALREAALIDNPADKTNRLKRALLLVETEGRSMEGILDLRKLSEEFPEDAGIQTLLGDFAVRTAQWAKAEERYRKALSIAPLSGAPAAGLAKVLLQTGRMDEAKKYAQTSLNDKSLNAVLQNELKVLFNL